MSVDIVMATYNGARFVRKQIESIQNQSYTNWRLLISDDCSTDNTLEILKEISLVDSRVHIVNNERQGGVVKNFDKALESVTAKYIFFCDQDDYWPEHRLATMLVFFIKNEKDAPLMIYTDLTLIDENNRVISNSYYEVNAIKPAENLDFQRLRWKSSIYGCSTMINKSLLEVALPFPEHVTMHDHWLGLIATLKGQLIYLNYKSVLYRQHSTNVVGGKKNTFLDKVSSFKKNLRRIEEVSIKTIEMQKNLDERFDVKFCRTSFIFNNLLPGFFKNSKRAYTIIFMVYFIKCSI